MSWQISDNKACYQSSVPNGALVQENKLLIGARFFFQFRITDMTQGMVLVPSVDQDGEDRVFNANDIYVVSGVATIANVVFVAGEDENGNVFDGCISIISIKSIEDGPFKEAETESFCADNCLKKIEYWNDEDSTNNDINIVYSMGYKNTMFIRSQFIEEDYEEERTVYINSANTRDKLRSQLSKSILLKTDDMPPYAREKIAVALTHDHFTIDGVEYVANDNLSIDHRERFILAKSSIKLFKKDYNIQNDHC